MKPTRAPNLYRLHFMTTSGIMVGCGWRAFDCFVNLDLDAYRVAQLLNVHQIAASINILLFLD